MAFTTANGETATPLGKIRDIPVRFGNATIPIDCIVVDTATYDLILGNEWLVKAKATVDLNAEAMRITWKGKRYEVPLNMDRGVKPRIIEDTDGYYTILEEAFTTLTSEQESKLRQLTMQWQWCPVCDKKVYCAELLCQCASTFTTQENFEQLITQWTKKADKLQKNREKRIQKEIETQATWADLTKERDPHTLPAFNGENPNPTRELWLPPYLAFGSGKDLWDTVLEMFKKMGQDQLYGDRQMYRQGRYYWNEYRPEDVWKAMHYAGYSPSWVPIKTYKTIEADLPWKKEQKLPLQYVTSELEHKQSNSAETCPAKPM